MQSLGAPFTLPMQAVTGQLGIRWLTSDYVVDDIVCHCYQPHLIFGHGRSFDYCQVNPLDQTVAALVNFNMDDEIELSVIEHGTPHEWEAQEVRHMPTRAHKLKQPLARILMTDVRDEV